MPSNSLPGSLPGSLTTNSLATLLPSPQTKADLLHLLTVHSYRKQRVTLASGRESDFFIDCKQTVLLGAGHLHAGILMLDAARSLTADLRAVAGVELGGCPLASAAATVHALIRQPSESAVDALYVRKGAKDHGSKRLIEGNDAVKPGSAVVVLEDVVTTGGSTLKAVQLLREHGLTVTGVVALVDREEGGREAIMAGSLKFASIFKKSDFGVA